jgi:hypothetical protein
MRPSQLFTQVQRADLRQSALNPQASFALACWTMARGDGELPDESTYQRYLSSSLRDDMVVMRVLPDGEFLYRHFGANVECRAGYSMAGKLVSDFAGELRDFHTTLYSDVVRSRSPIASLHRLGHYRERPLWDRLVLPCAAEGGIRALYAVNVVREIQHDAKHLKVSSRENGLLVLDFEHNEDGDLLDAVMIGANNAALSITGRRLDEVLDRSAAACFPSLRESGLWQTFQEVARTRQSRICQLNGVHDDAGSTVVAKVSPFHLGFSVEFSPRAGAVFR